MRLCSLEAACEQGYIFRDQENRHGFCPPMPLTDTKIRNTKPQTKPYKLADEKGLFLLVHPNGSRYWRWKFYFAGKEKQMAFGVYPDVSLKDAREKRDEARKILANGENPSFKRRAEKRAAKLAQAHTFETVASEFLEKQRLRWTEKHIKGVSSRLHANVFQYIGDRPIGGSDRFPCTPCLLSAECSGATNSGCCSIRSFVQGTLCRCR